LGGKGTGQPRLSIGRPTPGEQREIHRLRHAVYAHELGQHPVNRDGMLRDGLDRFNTYIVARIGGKVAGFVSITPPPANNVKALHAYSIDKYVSRNDLPFDLDAGVYEIRLLTVDRVFRRSRAASLLMYAALRWIEERGGTRVVAIGRRELMRMYGRLGMEPLGIVVRSGHLSFEVMTATVEALRHRLDALPRLRRVTRGTAWELQEAFEPPDTCYHGGSFFGAIGERFDTLQRRHRIINADVLDAWFDPSPKVLAALGRHLPWLLRTSPPVAAEGLQATIAEVRGVEPGHVLPGAGSSDLIYLALRQWLTPASRALILDPTYGEYAHVLERVVGCRVDRLTLRRDEGYAPDLDRLRDRLRRGYDLVVLVNPNSPTGRHVPREALEEILAAAPPTTRFWIDETYVEYAGRSEALERFAAASDNTVVCKSMSKVYALSGVRAAYLCGPRQLIDPLRPLNPPWAVSLPAQVAAVAALQDPGYYDRCYLKTHELRARLQRQLSDTCGLEVVDSVANFILCHLPQDAPSAARVTAACRDQDLFIRDVTNMGRHLGSRTVRIAVKDEATNERIVSTLAEVLHAPR
jgi:histidinol-phosphate/aromatic aminotransferase/cobyric acid decarboxylase-like protein/N-acyl-L-homoserine lactone synthetase